MATTTVERSLTPSAASGSGPRALDEATVSATTDPNDTDGGATPSQCFYVLVSTMDNTAPPVVFFPYPSSLQIERVCPPGYEVRKIPASSTSVRIGYAFTKRYMYNAMRQVFKSANLHKLTSTGFPSTTNWNIFWGHHLKSTEYSALMLHHRVNHIPGSFELGRKDRLCANLLRLRKKHPAAYSGIIPETYLTANDYDKQQFLLRYSAKPHALWILKPPNLSCGRGIKIVTFATTPTPKLTKKKAYVAQKYISDPFLINELKFDLRIYVLVTSYDPLSIFLYDDGLVRFCTEKYSTSKTGLQNQYGHLTNYSVNKKNTDAFHQNQDQDHNIDENEEHGENESCTGTNSSKWSLQSLYKYLRANGKATQLEGFHESLEELIVKTFIAVESKILMMATSSSSSGSCSSNGFELYGFDILLEGDEMKPWLLEVNVFPSLSSSSPMDKRIKTMLVCDMFQLIGVPFQDASVAMEQVERHKRERLVGVAKMTKKQPNTSDTSEKKSQKKKKTVEDLVNNSTKKGLLDTLDENDLRIVKTLEEEDSRRGNFKRIFPLATSYEKYSALFETQRYKTVLCMRWQQLLAQDPRRRPSAAMQNGKPS